MVLRRIWFEPYSGPRIHRSAWKVNSANSACTEYSDRTMLLIHLISQNTWPHRRLLSMTLEELRGPTALHARSILTGRVLARTPSTSKTLL